VTPGSATLSEEVAAHPLIGGRRNRASLYGVGSGLKIRRVVQSIFLSSGRSGSGPPNQVSPVPSHTPAEESAVESANANDVSEDRSSATHDTAVTSPVVPADAHAIFFVHKVTP
jgi:hypothetical protein